MVRVLIQVLHDWSEFTRARYQHPLVIDFMHQTKMNFPYRFRMSQFVHINKRNNEVFDVNQGTIQTKFGA